MDKMVRTFPLSGFDKTINQLNIREQTGFELVSIALAGGQENAAAKKLISYLGGALPTPSRFTDTKIGKTIWTGPNQCFLMTDEDNDRLDQELAAKFEGFAYFTLQTDGWACLDVSGDDIYRVLERFAPLDLSSAPVGFATRTTAHHMSVFVMKIAENKFTLLTPRSSANSFLHALEDVVENL